MVGLTEDEYFQMLRNHAQLGIIGGAIHDALLAACAIKVGADRIYTWNLRRYSQFGKSITDRLCPPATGSV